MGNNPTDNQIWVPSTCECYLTWQKWIRIPRCGDYLGSSRWAQNVITSVLTRDTQREIWLNKKRRGSDITSRERPKDAACYTPGFKDVEKGQKSIQRYSSRNWERQKIDSSLELPKKARPPHILDDNFNLTSRTVREYMGVVLIHQIWSDLLP